MTVPFWQGRNWFNIQNIYSENTPLHQCFLDDFANISQAVLCEFFGWFFFTKKQTNKIPI